MQPNIVRNYAFLLFCVLIALLVQGLAPYWPLAFDRAAISDGQWWRLLSGGWLHHNAAHLWMNLAALCLLWTFLIPPLGGGLCWLLLSLLVALVDAAIWLWVPQTIHYWGLSGALHGLFAIAACLQWLTQKRQAVLWLAGLGGKLLWDLWHPDGMTADWIGTRVHVESHLLGSGLGVILGIVLTLYLSRHSVSTNVNATKG